MAKKKIDVRQIYGCSARSTMVHSQPMNRSQRPDSFAKRHLNDNALRRKLPKKKGGPAISVLTAWMGTVGNIPMSMEG